jgi:hypothetical protein
MTENIFVDIGGITYRKSSYSNSGGQFCVGVSCADSVVMVTNTNQPSPVVHFTKEEWRAFVAGVKNNEFEID